MEARRGGSSSGTGSEDREDRAAAAALHSEIVRLRSRRSDEDEEGRHVAVLCGVVGVHRELEEEPRLRDPVGSAGHGGFRCDGSDGGGDRKLLVWEGGGGGDRGGGGVCFAAVACAAVSAWLSSNRKNVGRVLSLSCNGLIDSLIDQIVDGLFYETTDLSDWSDEV
ncbi:stress enhanced protein 2 [Prunus dulcis]|uniref:Stress enhanced protein 2 n=1 Tax=Prunus dulcis TaxID=3755 RepID=A0A5H2XQK3_PRUDU|nr:stress enhanced protein 2 [Prunus dulcis]